MGYVIKKAVSPQTWSGTWNISLDANPRAIRELVIAETKKDCIETPWCNLIVFLKSRTGETKTGEIEKMDGNYHHIVFSIPPLRFYARLSDCLNQMEGYNVNVNARDKKRKRGFHGFRK